MLINVIPSMVNPLPKKDSPALDMLIEAKVLSESVSCFISSILGSSFEYMILLVQTKETVLGHNSMVRQWGRFLDAF